MCDTSASCMQAGSLPETLWLRPRCMTQVALVLRGHITDVSTLSIPVFAALESQPAGQLAGPRHLQPAQSHARSTTDQHFGLSKRTACVPNLIMSQPRVCHHTLLWHAAESHMQGQVTCRRHICASSCFWRCCALSVLYGSSMHACIADIAIVSLLSPATRSQLICTRTLGELPTSHTLTE